MPPVQRTLFTVLGVPWKWTRTAWRFIPTRLGFGSVTALLFLQTETLGARLFFGVIYAALLLLSQCLHIVGHTLGGILVGAPMAANLILDTKILTYYANDPPDLPRRVHLSRALGGPVLNTLIGLIALVAWAFVGGHVLLYFVIINLLLGPGILLPFPGVDGEVLWRELFRKPASPDRTSRPK